MVETNVLAVPLNRLFAGNQLVPFSTKRCGNHFCDDGNNHAGCGWDGGDCCGKKVNKKFCKKCKCLDPKAI